MATFQGSYDTSTGTYTDASGQKFSKAPPQDTYVVQTQQSEAQPGVTAPAPQSRRSGGRSFQGQGSYDTSTGTYTDASGQKFSEAPPQDTYVVDKTKQKAYPNLVKRTKLTSINQRPDRPAGELRAATESERQELQKAQTPFNRIKTTIQRTGPIARYANPDFIPASQAVQQGKLETGATVVSSVIDIVTLPAAATVGTFALSRQGVVSASQGLIKSASKLPVVARVTGQTAINWGTSNLAYETYGKYLEVRTGADRPTKQDLARFAPIYEQAALEQQTKSRQQTKSGVLEGLGKIVTPGLYNIDVFEQSVRSSLIKKGVPASDVQRLTKQLTTERRIRTQSELVGNLASGVASERAGQLNFQTISTKNPLLKRGLAAGYAGIGEGMSQVGLEQKSRGDTRSLMSTKKNQINYFGQNLKLTRSQELLAGGVFGFGTAFSLGALGGIGKTGKSTKQAKALGTAADIYGNIIDPLEKPSDILSSPFERVTSLPRGPRVTTIVPSSTPNLTPATTLINTRSETKTLEQIIQPSSTIQVPPNVPPNIPPNIPPNVPPNVPPNIPPNIPPNVPPKIPPPNVPSKLPANVPSNVPPNVPSNVPSNVPVFTPRFKAPPPLFPGLSGPASSGTGKASKRKRRTYVDELSLIFATTGLGASPSTRQPKPKSSTKKQSKPQFPTLTDPFSFAPTPLYETKKSKKKKKRKSNSLFPTLRFAL